MSDATVITVRLLVAVGVVVVVPVALRLIAGVPARLVRWWPAAGAVGAISMWLPRGAVATAAAGLYAATTLLLAGVAVTRARAWLRSRLRSRGYRPDDLTVDAALTLAVVTALLCPAVAATALVAERAGYRLFGFDLDILTLTVPHLHYAGLVAALVAGLVARSVVRESAAAARRNTDGGVAVDAAGDPWSRRAAVGAALTVPVGTVTVLVGYFIGDWAELVGAAVLTCGMWLTGWLVWTRRASMITEFSGGTAPVGSRDHAVPVPVPVPVLFAVSAVVLVATMLLALWWAVGEATDWPHPSLGWMVGTHGVTNALGFGLCAVLAWRSLPEEAL